jgi:hypothetical protein
VATLTLVTFTVGQGTTLLGYGTLDLLTPISFALAAVGVAGYAARTRETWNRLALAGFVAFFGGLAGAFAGASVYVGLGTLGGWTISVWSYFLALVGASVFGLGLLWAGVPPRSGAVLLAGALPVGLGASIALAVGGVIPDEAVVPVGPGVLLGSGIAVLGWWVWNAESEVG